MAKMTLDEFVAQLKAAFGSTLRTVAVYGSAAAGEQHAGKSDTNVLVVVDSLSGEQLKRASAAIASWTESNTAPLLLTADEWKGSADIFAMEFADIRDRHRLLHGAFPAEIRVQPEHLRLQLEREAMTAVLQLRRGSLATGGDGKSQLEILERGAGTLLALFRATLRLKGDAPPKDDVDLATAVAKVSGADATPFTRIIQHRRGSVPLKPSDAPQVVSGTLDGLQHLVRYLDQYKGR